MIMKISPHNKHAVNALMQKQIQTNAITHTDTHIYALYVIPIVCGLKIQFYQKP